MPRRARAKIDASGLTRMQQRKLDALLRWVGVDIGERAFAEWRASQAAAGAKTDSNAAAIADALWPLIEEGRLAIPRGGYRVRRGRRRVIVEPVGP